MTVFATTTGTAAAGNSLWMTLGYVVLIGAMFYFLLIRPSKKQTKTRTEMMNKLSIGDEVYTNGGILGTITRIKENTVWLKISDKVEIELLKDAVSGVIKDRKFIDQETSENK